MDENNVYHTSSSYNFISEKTGDRLAMNWNQNLELELIIIIIIFWENILELGLIRNELSVPGSGQGYLKLGLISRTGTGIKINVFQELDIGFHFCVELELELEAP